VLLLVVVLIEGLTLSGLILIPGAASIGDIAHDREEQPDSIVLGIQFSPNPVSSGSTVQVKGGLSLPYDYTIEEPSCEISSNLNVFQGQPACTLNYDGSIQGSFQVSPAALPGDYTIEITAFFSLVPPNEPYNQIWNCIETEIVSTATSVGSYNSIIITYSTSFGWGCHVDDTATLTIWSAPQARTITVIASKTIMQTSTVTEPIEVCSQLPAEEAIAVISATAAVTTLATRSYLKRHPRFLFDVEVKSGVEEDKSN